MMITVVGVGALGSHLVQFLRSLKTPDGQEVSLRAVDFDRVEQKNLASQFHGKPGVGKLKVDALKQTMDFLYKRPIQTNSNKVVADNISAVLLPHDAVNLPLAHLVVDCLDNGVSRRLVQAYVRAHNIPCLHGALAAGGAFGRVIWDEGFVVDDETAGVPTCEDGEFLPFIALTSAYLAQAVQEFVTTKQKVGWSISPGGAFRV
jgi:molybdopterin/thiamine biosynthesis adenylyltransferase